MQKILGASVGYEGVNTAAFHSSLVPFHNNESAFFFLAKSNSCDLKSRCDKTILRFYVSF